MSKKWGIVVMVIGGVFTLLFLVTLLLPNEYRVVRTIKTDAAPEQVAAIVQDISTWQNWSPWKFSTDQADITITGEAGLPDQTYSWKGQETGSGTVKMFRIEPAGGVKYTMQAANSGLLINGEIKLEYLQNGGTKVFSIIEGDLGNNPLLRIYGFFIDKSFGPELEGSLRGLISQLSN